MIRKMQKSDIDRVAEIWLDTNLKAHDFISEQYWRSNFDMVKEMFPQAEVYVYEGDGKVQGFIGLDGEYIEGIFVCDEMQSQGDRQSFARLCEKQKVGIALECISEKHSGDTFLSKRGLLGSERGT